MINKVYLEPEEVASLEKSATNLRDRLLIRLLFHLGCRISEALALLVEDVDLENGSVTIQHLKACIRLLCPQCNTRLGRGHTFCPGCGEKVSQALVIEQQRHMMRTLPVDNETMAMLKHFIRHGGPVSRDGRELIFGINRHRAWQIVRECAETAGLPNMINPETGRIHGVSPHRLRDAFAIRAMKVDDSGDGLRLLQEHLGHASFSTTAKYRKVAGEELKTWYNKLWEAEDGC